jgi:hypothetical protein
MCGGSIEYEARLNRAKEEEKRKKKKKSHKKDK